MNPSRQDRAPPLPHAQLEALAQADMAKLE
jgi:hypothetical protein